MYIKTLLQFISSFTNGKFISYILGIDLKLFSDVLNFVHFIYAGQTTSRVY